MIRGQAGRSTCGTGGWLRREMVANVGARAVLREELSHAVLSGAFDRGGLRPIHFQFLTAGGSGRWHYLILEDPGQLTKLWFKTEQTDVDHGPRVLRSGSGLAFLATVSRLS